MASLIPGCNMGEVHMWIEAVVTDSEPYRRYCRKCGLILVGPWPDPQVVRRKKKLNEAGLVSEKMLRRLIRLQERDGRGCFYCHGALSIVVGKLDQGTIDHYVPRSKGGSDRFENLRACCLRCNQAKGDLLPEVFLARIRSTGVEAG